MLQMANQLSRAGGIYTVPGHLSFQMFHRLPAGGADLRRLKGALCPATGRDHGANDIGDHIASAFEQHTVTHANIFFSDIFKIVQGGLFDNHTADLHRFEHGIGC